MNTPIYRPSRPGDEPALKALWQAVYHDNEDCVNYYFNQVYSPGLAVVAQENGALCSAIHLMEGFVLHFPGTADRTCTYLYALGTPEAYRGRGLGGRTIWESGVLGYHRGADLVCFLPASESLFGWYESILGTRTVFFHREFSVTGQADCRIRITPCSGGIYTAQREVLLQDTPHAQCPPKLADYQDTLCRTYGGGLYQLELDGARALAAADRDGDSVCIRELLCPYDWVETAAAALCAHLGGRTAQVRTPAFWHSALGETQENAVRFPGGVSFPIGVLPYWGLAFD